MQSMPLGTDWVNHSASLGILAAVTLAPVFYACSLLCFASTGLEVLGIESFKCHIG